MVLGFHIVSDPQITEGKRIIENMDGKYRCLYKIGEAVSYINLFKTSTWAGIGWTAMAMPRTRVSSSVGRSSSVIIARI